MSLINLINNSYFNLIRSVWHYGAKWRFLILSYYFGLTAAQVFMSLNPFVFGEAINELQNFKPENMGTLLFWLLSGVGLMLLFWVFHGPSRIIECDVALKVQQEFKLNIYKQLMKLPLKWHQDHHSGNIITRINRTALALHKFSENQFLYIHTIVKFFIATGFLLWISIPVGIISVISSSLVVTIVVLFDRKLIPLYRGENEIENHIGSVFYDYISNVTTVLALRLGSLTSDNIFERMCSIWPIFRKRIVLNEVKWFTMMILFSIVQTTILVSYILYSLNVLEVIMIGHVVMIFRYQWDINDAFQDLSTHYGDIVRMDIDTKSVQPILEDIKLHTKKLDEFSPKINDWKNIKIKSLSFCHSSENRNNQIFDNISFEISRGEKIALIGLSGGGKSTLLNLLSGFYIPSKVNLYIDKHTYNTLDPIKSIATLIPQDPEIFENTIAFNITMDLPTAPEEIDHCIKISGFSNVLSSLPDGLNTDIREKGLNFSVGQKQRLALARGLFAARFSSLILLDEPTSSVDLPTESEILLNVLNNFPNETLIVSLHRLHLLQKFDRIIMLNHGKIVADGSVSYLLSTPGLVKDLWESYQHKNEQKISA